MYYYNALITSKNIKEKVYRVAKK